MNKRSSRIIFKTLLNVLGLSENIIGKRKYLYLNSKLSFDEHVNFPKGTKG
jgi:hypothetical protein